MTAVRTRNIARPVAVPKSVRNLHFPVSASAGYLIRDIHRAMSQELSRRIAPYGVSLGMWFFFRVLWVEDGLTQRELARRVRMTEPTAVAALKAMEKGGFIGRIQDTDDRRKFYIMLTPKGRGLEALLMPLIMRLTADVLNGVSPTDAAKLMRLLNHVHQNVDRMGKQRQSAGKIERRRGAS